MLRLENSLVKINVSKDNEQVSSSEKKGTVDILNYQFS